MPNRKIRSAMILTPTVVLVNDGISATVAISSWLSLNEFGLYTFSRITCKWAQSGMAVELTGESDYSWRRFWSSEQQSPSCYTLSPHPVAKIRADAAAERVRKKNFSTPTLRAKRQGWLRKNAGPRLTSRSHGSPSVRAGSRSTTTATRSVNLAFENHVDFFGVDGLTSFQTINRLFYLKLPENP
jgi:hypothetical protein